MNPDLRKRIPTAVLYVIFIAGASLMGSEATMIMLWIFLSLCTYEFVSTEFKRGGIMLQPFHTIMVHIVVSMGIFLSFAYSDILYLSIGMCVLFLLMGMMLWLRHKSLLTLMPRALRPLFFLAIPFLLGIHVVYVHPAFRFVILGSFIMIWLNDAGAYFVGKAIGKKKILVAVSPGKSWEGWIGGLCVGVLGGSIISLFLDMMTTGQWIMLAMIVGIIGLVGDLTESNWKRAHGIKDSSAILPGHGGMLDRLDSFIYCLPFIVLFYLHHDFITI